MLRALREPLFSVEKNELDRVGVVQHWLQIVYDVRLICFSLACCRSQGEGREGDAGPATPGVVGGPSPPVDGGAEGLRAGAGGAGGGTGEVEGRGARQRGQGFQVAGMGRWGEC